jgi:hypothetical protein
MLFDVYGQTGLTGGMLALFLIVTIWEIVWKGFGMWKSARRGSPIWFIAILIFNTVGILPILYIFVFSELGKKKKKGK